jgi:hypothetical protein
MSKQLSDQVIAARMTEWRNLKQMHARDRKQITALKAENKQLRSMLADQKASFASIIETQNARIAELEKMVFGQKKHFRSGGGHTVLKQPRDAGSYRRPIPPTPEITSEAHHAINACHHCGGPLTDKQEYTRYAEDIVLAALDPTVRFKTVERQTIERGYCVSYGKYSSAKDLRGATVTLGPNVRTLICYLITLRDHSYDQVIHILWDLYRFKATDGEIINILDTRRLQFLPEYEQLKKNIRAGPGVHMDESRWKIQSEGAGYAWSMSSTTNSDVVFKLADSRGLGNAQDLLGENFQGVGITDRYGAYKHLFALHQICWAHVQRTAKDLTHLECLSKTKQRHVTKFYQNLAAIYAAIRKYQTEPFDETVRKVQANQPSVYRTNWIPRNWLL